MPFTFSHRFQIISPETLNFITQLKKPSVPKRWLHLISGLLWTGVGLLLNNFASGWISEYEQNVILVLVVLGVTIGLLISYFGFRHISKKNIDRINDLPDPVCIFAFQAWENYILVFVMMSMGIILRTTSFFPKILLAPFYIGIGLALILSGLPYYRAFCRTK